LNCKVDQRRNITFQKKKIPREFTNRNASSFENFPLWPHDKVLKEKQLLLELQISKKQKDEVKLTMD